MNPTLTKRRLAWLTLLLGTVSATGPLAIDLYLPALPQMKTQFATTASLMQLSITACLIGLALGQLIAGPLSDQYGRRKPLIIGFILFGLVSLAMAFIHSVALLIILRFIQGLAGATGQVLARAVARDLFSGERLTHFYALLNTVNGVFPIIAPIIGGFMIRYVDWQAIFILLAIIGIVIAIAVAVGLHESLPVDQRQTGGFNASLVAMGKLTVQPSFWPLILATGLVYGALFSYISASTFVFQTGFGMAPQTFSLLYAFNGLGIVVGSNLPGRLAGHFSNRQQVTGLLLAATTASGILLISLLFPANVWLVAGLVLILVILIGALLTLTVTIIMDQATHNAGSASAVIGLSQDACGGIVSPLVGVSGSSYAAMSVMLLVCSLGAFGLVKYQGHHIKS
ncbi:major facilitator superfamily permease [Levilactobacillus koreensis JCM 16448]|uniref:Bcr/CflA family efflux transporter n=1 Tax=Levilactobacillus koreensis TaxID=637971 RepID=A0AAC8UW68_9LACO|nr:multidrug effflux MFS transporter [Levilactobacillus koreensis]AKP64549.1 MFS transporter permease [Levilactobacillus koreensis]KRK91765.1 major facilitator superfamily permease [Levilactobacillus koreensis JCM 16448]